MPIDEKLVRVAVLRYAASFLETDRPQLTLRNAEGTGLYDVAAPAGTKSSGAVCAAAYQGFHDLVKYGIIVPGTEEHPYQWPHFRITKRGREVLSRPIDTLVDAGAYIDQLRAKAPNVGAPVSFYARQSIVCMQAHAPTPAAVMLGCAIENMLREFTDTVLDSLPTNEERLALSHKLALATEIGPMCKTLWEHLELRLSMCPANLREQVDRELLERMSANYHLLRRIRDERTRPAICDFSEDETYSLLLRFPSDAELLYGLVAFLRTGTI